MNPNITTRRDETARTSGRFRAAAAAAIDSVTTNVAGSCIDDQAWTPYARQESARLVMLLLDSRSIPQLAIDRAVALSNGLSARLHVLLSIPRGTASVHPALLASHVSALLEAQPPRRGFDLEVLHGPIRQRGIEIAGEMNPDVVVVDASFGAAAACRAVDRLGIPVLVARDARVDGKLVAASNLMSLGFPVLSLARDYGRALDREVIFFHNAKPVPVYMSDPMAGAASYIAMLQLQDDTAAARRARLRTVAGKDHKVAAVVTRQPSTVEAILGLARERDADVVVVGHRPRSWLSHLLDRGVTERVVNRSRRSVLIAPVHRDVA